ncbi:hypothetical protein CBR_g49078 [Chara braunii]|uniref:F-box domain-containing protein n=1 Tax=Chara braunii TaxID=69332 RepID=A0A388M450_CHABU|nr:hypothetical protein CBR_g49078 [Chara braunii]|eukprot:GBG89368.1 hypothetical protein CBR_g49078 [Chara braunii]
MSPLTPRSPRCCSSFSSSSSSSSRVTRADDVARLSCTYSPGWASSSPSLPASATRSPCSSSTDFSTIASVKAARRLSAIAGSRDESLGSPEIPVKTMEKASDHVTGSTSNECTADGSCKQPQVCCPSNEDGDKLIATRGQALDAYAGGEESQGDAHGRRQLTEDNFKGEADASALRQCDAENQRVNSDVWLSIISFLKAKEVVTVAMLNHEFNLLAMEEEVWRCVCERQLGIVIPGGLSKPSLSWRALFRSVTDGRHSFKYQQQDKHLDWMRLGVFEVRSGMVIATDTLRADNKGKQGHCEDGAVNSAKASRSDPSSSLPAFSSSAPSSSSEVDAYRVSREDGFSQAIGNVRRGSWIADMHLLRCPLCDSPTCEGTMQALDAWHSELFLHDEAVNKKWSYEELSARNRTDDVPAAVAAIFDAEEFNQPTTRCSNEMLNLKAWAGPVGDWQPRGRVSSFAAAVCTNLQENAGMNVKCYAMRAGDRGPVMGIRITQQLN